MSAPLLVSIVLSFRNEEPVIPELLDRLGRMFATELVDHEIIFVNDASTDRSLALLQDRASRDPCIRILNMSRRFGPAECALAGLRHARGDAAILMDADLQDPPEVIPQLIARWREGAEIVHTVRTARHGESALKMAATRLAYRVLRNMAEFDLPVEAGDFKLIGRRALDQVLTLGEHDPYLRGLVAWVGYTQAFVPYERQARFAGRTHFPFFSRNPWRTFLSGLTSFSVTPLVLLIPLGLAILVIGLLVPPALALADGPLPLWAWIVSLMLVLSGLQFAALGVVGLYLARVYTDVRGRPRYVIESAVGFDHPPMADEPLKRA